MSSMCQVCARSMMAMVRVSLRQWDDSGESDEQTLIDKTVCWSCAWKIVELLENLVAA